MRVLGMFEGIGGFAIASHWCGFESAQFVEIDPNAQKVLRHHFPAVPIHDDVRTFYANPSQFDIITAGFPCTGTSNAGLKTGLDHQESALFRDTLRIIENARPRFTVIENPPGLVNRGLRAILGGLRMVGYSSELIVVSAARLGAGHRRQRLFIVSYPHIGSGHPTIADLSRSSEVRAMVSQARDYAHWLQVKQCSYGGNNGFSLAMATKRSISRISFKGLVIPNGQRGRNTARILLGRSVTPQQAFIPLLRVKQLCRDLETSGSASGTGVN